METLPANRPQTSTYTYDPAGNRLSKTVNGMTTVYAYDDLNRLLAHDSTTYEHDLNGNRLSKDDGSEVTDYEYDTLNRLVAANENGSQVFEAEYDYRTRRVAKTEGGDTTLYRYDGGISFQEVDASGNVDVEFVRGSAMGGGIGSILYSDRDSSGGGGGSLTREYFTYNAVGHTVALTDALGDITKTTTYEAFGNTVSETGSSDNNRLANTKERDFSIGLDNHGYRYYDPSTGRYTTRDPIGYGDGPNVYLSVHSNPVNHIDPLGLESKGHHVVPRALWEDARPEVRRAFDAASARFTSPAYEATYLSDGTRALPTHNSLALNGVSVPKYNEAVRGLSLERFGKVPADLDARDASRLADYVKMVTTMDDTASRAAMGASQFVDDIHRYNNGVLSQIAEADSSWARRLGLKAGTVPGAGQIAHYRKALDAKLAKRIGKAAGEIVETAKPLLRRGAKILGPLAALIAVHEAKAAGWSDGGAAVAGVVDAVNPLPVGLVETVEGFKQTAGAVREVTDSKRSGGVGAKYFQADRSGAGDLMLDSQRDWEKNGGSPVRDH